ncbi:MAG: hypothetical protein K9M10_03115 [Candidatus Pacebacteria bacterium]|nr:hypothetical protein [Candidatus Paceibacterota bacterium]MCF7857444.1 hypothetical protein [Candidatus Paceibacterota bacterium]
MKKSTLLFFLLLTISFPSWLHAEEINAGFVQGIWYSSEPIFVGVPTRVYVAFRNNTQHDLTGTIRFTDNEKRIGSFEVSALSGRLVEAWIDWTPTFGEHSLAASLSEAELHILGEGVSPLDITDIAIEETVPVDYDSDKDGIGDQIDNDDDNDGVSDVDEKINGTDPLIPEKKIAPEIELSEIETELPNLLKLETANE